MPKMKTMAVNPIPEPTKRIPKEKVSPAETFAQISKANVFSEYNFIGIKNGDVIHLFNGNGKEIRSFENSHKGEVDCRVYTLYEIYLEIPEEKRNAGGYTIDFINSGESKFNLIQKRKGKEK